jgi:hypothetical protein
MTTGKVATKTTTLQDPIAEPAAPPQLPQVLQQPAPVIRAPAEPKEYPARVQDAILAVSQGMGSIQKQGMNEFQKYHYTRWDDINEKLSPLLVEHGLVMTQNELDCRMLGGDKSSVLAVTYEFVFSKKGEIWPAIRWTAIQRLYDQKGIPDDKAAAKCYTQAEKQVCIKLFKIRSDDSIDPEDERRPQRAADERVTYQKFLDEINGIHSLVELDQWKNDNLQRVRSALRDHWLGYFNVAFNEKRVDVSKAYADFDPDTGEVPLETPQKASSVSAAPKAAPPRSNPADGAAELTTDEADAKLTAAAERGIVALRAAWDTLSPEHKTSLRSALERRHKSNALKADAADA